MISIRRHLGCLIAYKRVKDSAKQQLENSQRKCAELMTVNLRQDETIRKLTAELRASQSFIATRVIMDHFVPNFALNEIPRRRSEAIERNRIEYENRVGAASQSDLSHLINAGYDEIDS